MNFGTKITERGATPRHQLRQANAIAKEVGAQLGTDWFAEILPQHFTHRGASRYGYQERKAKYNKAKLRKYGHTYPLVASRESITNILGHGQPGRKAATTPNLQVTATSGIAKIKVRIPGSQKLNYRSTPNSPNLREELTASDAEDDDFLSDRARQYHPLAVERITAQTTTTTQI